MSNKKIPAALREALEAPDPYSVDAGVEFGAPSWLVADRARAMAAALRWSEFGVGAGSDEALSMLEIIAALERESTLFRRQNAFELKEGD